MNIQVFNEIDSTQIEAKRQIDAVGFIADKIIVAVNQTNGITTKKGIPWQSQAGDVLMSWILNVNNQNIKINHILFCCSLAIRDILNDEREKIIASTDNKDKQQFLQEMKIEIKWPNDTLINKRKISGILAEFYKNHLIIGIAINLVKNSFKTTRIPATDFETLTGKLLDSKTFINNIYNKSKEYIDILLKYGFIPIKEKWKQYAYMLGQVVEKSDGNFVMFNDINDDGDIV